MANNTSSILVIGDIMLDIFSYGEVKRLNPEWPNPLLHITHETYKLWWAANVAANIKSLHTPCTLVGHIGNDIHGNHLLEAMHKEGIVYANIEHTTPTIVKQRFIESTYHQQMIRVDFEEISPLSATHMHETLWKIVHDRDYHFMIISDYNKGVISQETFQTIQQFAQMHNIKILVDAKPAQYSFLKDVFLMKPNFKEFCEIIGKNIENTNTEIETYALPLVQEKKTNLVITRWAKGATLITSTGKVSHFTTEARQVFDVTGAWDTFIATVTVALNMGKSLEEAVILWNRASGIVVGKTGTETVWYDEIFAS